MIKSKFALLCFFQNTSFSLFPLLAVFVRSNGTKTKQKPIGDRTPKSSRLCKRMELFMQH